MQIKQVQAKECYNLRESVLRPGQPKENWTFAEDNNQETIHLAALNSGCVVGVVSLLPEPRNGCQWRLRGMAVHPEFRGKGVGRNKVKGL